MVDENRKGGESGGDAISTFPLLDCFAISANPARDYLRSILSHMKDGVNT